MLNLELSISLSAELIAERGDSALFPFFVWENALTSVRRDGSLSLCGLSRCLGESGTIQ